MFDTTPEGIENIALGGESQTVEFKTKLPNGQTIARILAAFANTEGGILLIGVSDDGGIVGISDDEVGVTLDRLQRVASSLLPWPIEVGVVDIRGKNVSYAVVDKAPRIFSPVLTSRGELYQRLAGSVVAVDFGTSKTTAVISKEVILFVAMSFREEEEPALVDYYRAMERAVKETALTIKLTRVDLVEGDYEISQQIMDEIDKADIVLADFTLNARNVYFELGYARGKKRRIIQTARKGTELEFDIRNWRTLFYRNAAELEEKLIPELKKAYADVVEATS
jgi:hypothetical protein